MTTAKKTTAPHPPAAAIAADAHWAATRERLLNRTRPVLKLTICDDHETKQALAQAKFVHQQATEQADRNPEDEAAQAVLRDATANLTTAQAAVDDASIVLRFQALDRRTYKELIEAHKPTEDQSDDGYAFNLDTLGPVLIAASSLDGITEEDAAAFLDTWSQAEAEALLNTAFGVQREERMDLGKG
ncbi:hypothetical protein AB0L71_27975 [Streptomyces sp. NPDC052052]|uniref:hypothetical protein n=1 Tax=Streptomyces sp. NPDC052052 TaxID=3154756 RepID=UPI0034342D8F